MCNTGGSCDKYVHIVPVCHDSWNTFHTENDGITGTYQFHYNRTSICERMRKLSQHPARQTCKAFTNSPLEEGTDLFSILRFMYLSPLGR